MSDSAKVYLAACLAFRNEAPYLREWIEFHRAVGVERFYLYNHASVDEYREALAPYVEDGIVEVSDWADGPAVQTEMYNRCLGVHRHDARWLAVLDMDEFLFSPTGRSLPDLLAEYEEWPGVAACWSLFGSSGHRTKPDGLVIESYLWRSDDPEEPRNRLYKCVVDPERVETCLDPHVFAFTEGVLVDERKRPVEGQYLDGQLLSTLRINHYYTRSEEETIRKFARPRGSDAAVMRGGVAPLEHLHGKLNEKRDDSILPYVPAVRQALAEMNERAPFDPARAAANAQRRFEATFEADGRLQDREWGASALACIEIALAARARLVPRTNVGAVERILDFPCGRGRVMRVLRAAHPEAVITAADFDADAVAFCAEAFGAVPLQADEDPRRIETDATFDLIWCGGLFPRLGAERWPGFLAFLEARLAPWGVLLFSTHGRYQTLHGADPELRDAYLKTGFGYRDGVAVSSPGWVCRQLEQRPGLRLLGFAERGWNESEDVVACTRLGPRFVVAELLNERPGITAAELSALTGYDEQTLRPWLESPPKLPAR